MFTPSENDVKAGGERRDVKELDILKR